MVNLYYAVSSNHFLKGKYYDIFKPILKFIISSNSEGAHAYTVNWAIPFNIRPPPPYWGITWNPPSDIIFWEGIPVDLVKLATTPPEILRL